jgi:hypothetical protein
MKLKVFLTVLVVVILCNRNGEAMVNPVDVLNAGAGVFDVGSSIIGLIQATKQNVDLTDVVEANKAASQEIRNTMDNFHTKQMNQNKEHYMNTMLKLNGFDARFDAVSSQVTDVQGKLVDISGMLDGMDGKLDTITDLVLNIDVKMDNLSEQVCFYI